jgi:hypothetical protein
MSNTGPLANGLYPFIHRTRRPFITADAAVVPAPAPPPATPPVEGETGVNNSTIAPDKSRDKDSDN